MVSATSIRQQHARAAQRGLLTADFRKVSLNGFGDAGNAYAHSMAWFQNHLFVGTTRANLASRALQIAKNTPEKMKGMWPVRIPKTFWENNLQAEIWRHNPRSGDWTNVYTAPLVKGIDGFDVPISVGFRAMTVFQGDSDSAPALYVPTWGSHQTPTSLLLRSENGSDFQISTEPGTAVPEHKPRSIRGVLPFKNYLVACPVVGQARFEPNVAGHMVLLATTDPAGGKWFPISEPGFGDPGNVSVFQMAILNGYLYAGTMNVNEGFQIWKTNGDGGPPFHWKKVMEHGAGRGRLNQIAMSLRTFNNAIYVGSGIQNCSFDYDYNVGPAAPEVLRIHPDDSWDLIAGEPRITSQGLKIPLSGMGPAFSNPFVGYIWSMCDHDGYLYIGTGAWAVFLRYRELPEDLPDTVRNLLPWKLPKSRLDLETMLQQYGGCHLWRSRDGVDWQPVTQNGFGNSYNIGVRTQASSPYGLFAGTANPFGPDVAMQRVAGWRYEPNAKAGLEVWQGTTDRPPPAMEPPLPLRVVPLEGRPFDIDDGEEAEERICEALVEGFFARTSWRHVGYWQTGMREAPAACENLLAELCAFLPESVGRIVQVGAGDDSVLKWLVRRFSAEAVSTLVDGSYRYTNVLSRLATGSWLKNRQLAARSRAGKFDHAVWVDGLVPRQASLADMLSQSASALKNGGMLACFETLRKPRGKGRTANSGKNRYASSIEELRSRLVAAGLQEQRLIEVTTPCLTEFREQFSRFVTIRACTGEAPEMDFVNVEQHLCGPSHEIVGCVFLTAIKPQN